MVCFFCLLRYENPSFNSITHNIFLSPGISTDGLTTNWERNLSVNIHETPVKAYEFLKLTGFLNLMLIKLIC